jgi:DNA ligase-1
MGRSSTLLKVKTFFDAEAVVLRHEPGKGRHAGRLGALAVKLADGTEFSVGTGFSDRERSAPPAIGSLIRFRYQELSDAGVPRFPSYIGLRTDAETAAHEAVAPAPRQTTVPTHAKIRISKPAAEQPAAPAPQVAPNTTTTSPRYFECSEGSSRKFWEITIGGSDVTTRWGRIGTDGQSKTKSFGSEDKAMAEYSKLIKEKTDKGYIETGQA